MKTQALAHAARVNDYKTQLMKAYLELPLNHLRDCIIMMTKTGLFWSQY